MTIQEAKERMDVPAVAAKLFPNWKPALSSHSPWREDKNPSFSVYDSGRKWKDHATGDHGDAVDFLAKAQGLTPQEGIRLFIEMAGGHTIATAPRSVAANAEPKESDSSDTRCRRACWPKFELPTDDDLVALATLRNLPTVAGRWASTDGALRMAMIDNHRCWVLRSVCGCNAQARRLDGGKLLVNNKEIKAKTLAGSLATIPVGMFSDTRWPFVAIVEGGPDFIAAYGAIHRLGLLDQVQVCGILGASHKLQTGAVASLRHRHTRIFQHHDTAGREAANGWAAQIFKAGGTVDIWEPNTEEMDLNDLFHLSVDEQKAELQDAFTFVKGVR